MNNIYLKAFFIYIFLISYIENGLAQPSTSPILHASKKNEQWDLTKYIWSHAQHISSKYSKPALDFNAIDNWENIGPLSDRELSISPNGMYFAYSIYKGNDLTARNRKTIVVQSTNTTWQQVFSGANPGFFSEDSKFYIFKNENDLYFLPLGAAQPDIIKAIASYKYSRKGRGEWLAYQLKNSEATVIIEDLQTGRKNIFKNVSSYDFDHSGKWLICRLNNEVNGLLLHNLFTEKQIHFQSVTSYTFDREGKTLVLATTKQQNGIITSLQYIKLPGQETKTIWSTSGSNFRLINYSIDDSGEKVVFMVQRDSSSINENLIWYYHQSMSNPILKVNNQTNGIDTGLFIQGTPCFTDNGRYIQFSLQPRLDHRQPKPDAIKLDIWSHRDLILQSTQPYLLQKPIAYQAVIDLEKDQVIRLEDDYIKLYLLKNDFAVIKKSARAISDRFWEKDYSKDSNWLVSLKDGTRRILKTRGGDGTIWFTPGGSYIVYFDPNQGCHYFSYDLRTFKLANISYGINDWQLGDKDDYFHTRERPTRASGIACWINNDEGVLVYDKYDIWQLDLSGKKAPINFTNADGRKHKASFILMDCDRIESPPYPRSTWKDTLLLRVFNSQNKYQGFYYKVLGSTDAPSKLFIGPYFFQNPDGPRILNRGMKPLKATNSNTWIVKRQTATESPNYFLTDDFKNFKPLTNLQPHQGYNWLTAELHSFRQLDGTMSQGILYKPENFDPTQKYPVIVSFYTNMSNLRYQYPKPEYLNCPLISNDPAWLVSQGYLVFIPDIDFSKYAWGPSTVNSIDGAAKYLGKLPFVDSRRLGACGHSNSGRFGYYLFTHSQSFAAMCLGSGFGGTNIIDVALSTGRTAGVGNNESSNLEWAESGSTGSGLGNLWENKQSWIDHTAVINADKTKSPLLLFHNKKDGDDVMLAVQLFISLRRLERDVWWLQYDDGGHTVKGKDAKDFTIRYTQFFDHYLKGAPAPRWMTEGIPAKLKGIEDRYELDQMGSCGKYCPICKVRKSALPNQ